MATVKDVAREAGVSTATVSRVLNGTSYVEPDTALAVRNAIEKLDYRRDINWRRLAKQSSDTVAFLSGHRDNVNSNLVRTLVGCERIFNEAGYDLVFQTFRYSPETPFSQLRLPHLLANKGGIDGVVLVDIHHENLLQALTRYKVPFVGLGNNILAREEQLRKDLLIYDDVAALDNLTSALIAMGHRRIAFVAQPQPWFRRRLEGYRRAMDRGGLDELVFSDAARITNIDYGRRAAARLMAMARPPTAIIGGSDELAAGIWNELVNRGVSVPAQVSIAGFGDREEFSVLEPPLTSIAIAPERIGEELARMLLEKLRRPGLRLESRTLDCELMMRRSCAPPPMRSAAVDTAAR